MINCNMVCSIKSLFTLLVLSFLFLESCLPKVIPYTGDKAFVSDGGLPDYTNLDYWAAHPEKRDPSDSVPKPLRIKSQDKSIDVFFIHPTTYTDEQYATIPNARIDDPYLNSKTDNTSILYQASAFNAVGRIFAPRYRQAHIGMYYEKDTSKALAAFETAYSDVKAAFQQFLSWSKDRPIVIASHSQGTTHAKRLMKEFFDGKDLSSRLVVGYLAGIKVEKNLFSDIPVCKDTVSTGCVTSWRTYRKGYEGKYTSVSDTNTIVVNPVTWSHDGSFADRRLHKGAVLYTFNKTFKHTHSTQVVGDMLWISKPRFPGAFLYNTQNYHAGDINLFYLDIREDVLRRASYFKSGSR
jgi:hypothetical protein